MRLTVGPLPAAVYWRRRGVVLVGLAMIVDLWYAFSGPDGSANTTCRPDGERRAGPHRHQAPHGYRADSYDRVTHRLRVHTAGGRRRPDRAPTPKSRSPPRPRRPRSRVGTETVAFTIKIKNISSRTCVRDIGADVQELPLKDGDTIDLVVGRLRRRTRQDLKQFTPGQEVSFTRTWHGLRSRGGDNTVDCDLTLVPDAEGLPVVRPARPEAQRPVRVDDQTQRDRRRPERQVARGAPAT